MNINLDPLREWFGYSRMERRASAILLIIIVCVISLRFFIPDRNIPLEITSLEEPYDSLKTEGKSKHPQSFKHVQSVKYQGRQAIRQPVELNSCDTSELVKLPGIGPVLSARIIKYRNLLGGFADVNQLKEVYGLPPETYELIRDHLRADTLLIQLIDINTAEYKRLSRMPYLEKDDIRKILKYRELKGQIKSMNEIVDNQLVSRENAARIRPYLRFE